MRPLRERLSDHSPVYLVGGAVRDVLLGGTPSELDLVVEGDAVRIAEQLGGTTVIHDRFGTSTVRLGSYRYDIARARREVYARPGALPEVTPATLAEDLSRRDFTVNAIATAFAGAGAGTPEAVPGALDDLGAHRLRVMHDHSFIDDPTRLLRLVRYASRLAFEIEPHTMSLARTAISSGALRTVSGARVGAELRLLAREPDPVAALTLLHELRLDAAIHSSFGISSAEPARRALELLPTDGRRDLLALAVAGCELPGSELTALLDQLAFSSTDRDAVVSIATQADPLARSLAQAKMPSEVAAAVGGSGAELVALAGAQGAERPAREWLDRLRHVQLEIDGGDLLAAGVPEGPQVGVALKAALGAKLDGRASGREAELQAALRGTGENQ